MQTKPHKGEYARNLDDLREVFAQLVQSGDPPQLVLLPEAALTGYFLEGAVYELALDRELFGRDLSSAWLESARGHEVDIACGYYENDGGTYYNSALYLHVGSDGSVSPS
ncbi:MAG: nitrilase-related carbon-nitrogen hydrolase, partial [Rhodanobacteraceae bacterium]